MRVLDITQMLRGCHHGLSGAKWRTLSEDSTLNGIAYAAGSQYKTFVTQNFGWVVFHPLTKTPEGHVPGRKIHRV